MKKIAAAALLTMCVLFSGGSSWAATSEWVAVWSDYRDYDTTYFTNSDWWQTYLDWEVSGLTEIDGLVATVTLSTGVSETLSGSVSGTTGYWGLSIGQVYSASDYEMSTWAATYTFTLKNASGEVLLTSTVTRTEEELSFLSSPVVTSITGNTVSWTEVADADYYKVRLLDEDTGETLYDFNAGDSLSFDLTGLVIEGTYRLRIEAREEDDSDGTFTTRSQYYSMISVSAVPVPGTLWLLGSGILLLAGSRRR